MPLWRGEFWQERLPLLEAAIGRFQPDLVILDGIRDLTDDINDGVKAQQVIEQLMHMASARHCCIVCIMHQNKAQEDRSMRGWLGTELKNMLFGDALPNGLELDEQALMQKVMDLVSMTSPKLFYSVLNKAVKEGVVSQLLDNFNRKRYSLA